MMAAASQRSHLQIDEAGQKQFSPARATIADVRAILAAAVLGLLALAAVHPMPVFAAANCSGTSTGLVPLPDLGSGYYQGEQGGLYAGGTNEPPAAYATAGGRAARAIVPRDAAGSPSAAGKIALLSIGMSNTNMEFSAFEMVERSDPTIDSHVVLVNGAQGGQDAARWVDPGSPVWTRADNQLAQSGISSPQVQAVWLLQAQASPSSDFKGYEASLHDQLAAIVKAAAGRFPNLRQVFVSPRIYGGYASTRLNPEPYAYQSGFADRLLVQESVRDPESRPWVGWGPYLWADGTTPSRAGVSWSCGDFSQNDGTHPSPQGAQKVAALLQRFFRTAGATTWFRGAAGQPPALASPQPAPPPREAQSLSSRWLPLGLGLIAIVTGAIVSALWRRRRGGRER